MKFDYKFSRPLLIDKIICTAAIVGLAVAGGLDFALTYAGIRFLGIGVQLPVVGQAGVAVGYSLVLAATLVAAELSLARGTWRDTHGTRRWHAVVVAVAAMATVQGVGATLHFIQIMNAAHGEKLVDTLASDVTTLTSQALQTDQAIQAAYHRAVSVEEGLGRDSALGHDETGIAVCGALCKGARQKARHITEQQADLGQPIDPGDASGGDDVAAKYARLTFVMSALQAKSQGYLALCDGMGWKCSDPLVAIRNSLPFQRVERAFSGSLIPDRQKLVLSNSAGELQALWRLDASLQTVLLTIFVIALPVAELVLVMLLGQALMPWHPVDDHQLEEARRRNRLLDEAVHLEAEMAAKEAVLRAEAGRRGEDVDDRVDA